MSTTITKVANVIIPVADQDKALAFYTKVLGFETRADAEFAPGNRWIEVAAAGADTSIAICPPGPEVTPGNKETGITLETNDIDAYHAHLKKQTVDVDPEISRFGDAVPPMFWFRDPEGNRLMVVQGA